MPVNRDKPQNWKADMNESVDMYNRWFMDFAPEAFRDARVKATNVVEVALAKTSNLTKVTPDVLGSTPDVLPTLRMAACPPLAVGRLAGLAGISTSLVKSLDQGKIPARRKQEDLEAELVKIGDIVKRMADPDIFVWIGRSDPATDIEVHRASTIIADRLSGSWANPII